MNAINFEGVKFKYDKHAEKNIIDGIDLQIEKGDFVCILGANGSGKSTSAKLINALLTPDEGEITVLQIKQDKKENIFEIRKNVGMVFQNPDNQMVATIVEDDVAFGPENIGVPSEEIGERIDFALDATDMQAFRYSAGQRLSGGQKQRIAIAGALAIKPNVLILDESTAMLDPKGRREVMDVAKKLHESGVTVINITHYMDEAVNADKIIVMNKGRVVASGTPLAIFNDVEMVKASKLDLPRAVYIANELRIRGLPIKENILGKEELGEELCKLFVKI